MPRAKKAADPAPPDTPAADPLADLREPGDVDARYPQTQPGAEVAPVPEPPGDRDPLEQAVSEAVGAASMCWEPAPEGVFQSEQASAVVVDLVAALRPLLQVQATTADEAVKRWHGDSVAVGFLHRGGRCGCAYLARVILGA